MLKVQLVRVYVDTANNEAKSDKESNTWELPPEGNFFMEEKPFVCCTFVISDFHSLQFIFPGLSEEIRWNW